jgi:hypothetical protein
MVPHDCSSNVGNRSQKRGICHHRGFHDGFKGNFLLVLGNRVSRPLKWFLQQPVQAARVRDNGAYSLSNHSVVREASRLQTFPLYQPLLSGIDARFNIGHFSTPAATDIFIPLVSLPDGMQALRAHAAPTLVEEYDALPSGQSAIRRRCAPAQ